ncbi:hypothetical protein EVAR_21382_1 [Eumeta japonica]|uniref:Uncharacterized protein n=1 Tax=Eumeta variegata TaxID=151549 RepID=A0A4C1VHR6_EUMVA|nr:hypothetical protein EVAR_21382_1 [Eumeta japonica]
MSVTMGVGSDDPPSTGAERGPRPLIRNKNIMGSCASAVGWPAAGAASACDIDVTSYMGRKNAAKVTCACAARDARERNVPHASAPSCPEVAGYCYATVYALA